MFKVQVWSWNNNCWAHHSVNDTRVKAMKELLFLESCHRIGRVIHEGKIIAESEGSYERE